MTQQKKCDLTDPVVENQFISLCELQCTREEVCGFFRIGDETLRRRIKEAYGPDATWRSCFEKFSVGGKISLRRTQFKLAQKSAALAIFLGKNYLNQTDMKTVQDVTKPIEINWSDAGRKAAKEGLETLESSIDAKSPEVRTSPDLDTSKPVDKTKKAQ